MRRLVAMQYWVSRVLIYSRWFTYEWYKPAFWKLFKSVFGLSLYFTLFKNHNSNWHSIQQAACSYLYRSTRIWWTKHFRDFCFPVLNTLWIICWGTAGNLWQKLDINDFKPWMFFGWAKQFSTKSTFRDFSCICSSKLYIYETKDHLVMQICFWLAYSQGKRLMFIFLISGYFVIFQSRGG